MGHGTRCVPAVAGTAWGGIMAVTVVAFLSTVIFAFMLQKWLVRGLTFGTVK